MKGSIISFLVLISVVVSINTAWGSRKVTCADGDHYLIDIKDISIKYEATRFQGALSTLVSIAGNLKVEKQTLQTASVATQKWNEFLKGLVAGYNSCAITKKQYQEGLKHLYPQLVKDGNELSKLSTSMLAGRKIDENRLEKILNGYFSNLKKFASLSGQDKLFDQISNFVTNTIRQSEERIIASHKASEAKIIQIETDNQEALLKRFEELERRLLENPLATPPQVQAEVSELKHSLLAKADEAESAYNEGYRLFNCYRFAEAVPHFRKALSLVKLADFYLALGQAYQELPDLPQAEQVLREGLTLAEESKEEQKEAQLANQLGLTLLDKGDLDGALRYAEQALKISEKVNGPDHPNVAICANNIGQILKDKGDLDGALRFSERALKINEKIYGPDHSNVAKDASNIGQILQAKGELVMALRYTERALKIDEKVYGSDHPHVAKDANNIGTILHDKGDLDGALRYAARALKIDEKAYGTDHPNVARDVNNIGQILKAKGDLDGALRYTEQALKIIEKIYGPDHPNMAICANNIDQILQDKGDLAGALRYAERALLIDEKVYGTEHPSVARDANNIGQILKDKGDLDGALRYAKKAMKIDEKIYGLDHPKVARDTNNIGLILQAKGDLVGALHCLEQALKIDEQAYGPNHPNVAIRAYNIGQILKDKGDLDGALRYTEQALQIFQKAYGPDNPSTKTVRKNYEAMKEDK